MKIMLINPNMLVNKDFALKEASFPLGLGYLAAIASDKKQDVVILDSLIEGIETCRPFNNHFNEYGLPDEAVLERIKQFKPKLIGVSCSFTSRWPIVSRLISRIKKEFPEAYIIIGGIHPTNSPESVLRDENVDFIAIGEAERTFEKFLSYLDGGKVKLADISGFGYKSDGVLHINKDIDFVKDLDDIPLPARDKLPYERYVSFNRNSIIATRGCPFKCLFCSMHTVMGRNYRKRSAKKVVDELELIKDRYGAAFFSFDDDNLTMDNKFIIELCDEIIRRKLNIYWNTPNGINISSLTYEGLAKMKQAGCYSTCLAIESGDERILGIMRKNISLKKVRQVVSWCRELGIFTLGLFVIGMPGENKESLEKTKEFALSLPLDVINVFIATPFPGTEFFDYCLEKGLLKDDSLDVFNCHEAVIHTGFLSPKEVKAFQLKFLEEFNSTKKVPFSLAILKRVVRNPGSLDFLVDLQQNYFGREKDSR